MKDESNRPHWQVCGKALNCLDIGGEGSSLIAAGGSDPTIRIWDPRKPGIWELELSCREISLLKYFLFLMMWFLYRNFKSYLSVLISYFLGFGLQVARQILVPFAVCIIWWESYAVGSKNCGTLKYYSILLYIICYYELNALTLW